MSGCASERASKRVLSFKTFLHAKEAALVVCNDIYDELSVEDLLHEYTATKTEILALQQIEGQHPLLREYKNPNNLFEQSKYKEYYRVKLTNKLKTIRDKVSALMEKHSIH